MVVFRPREIGAVNAGEQKTGTVKIFTVQAVFLKRSRIYRGIVAGTLDIFRYLLLKTYFGGARP